MNTLSPKSTLILISIAAAMIVSPPSAVLAQTGALVTITGCDTSAYPSVTCIVLPTEGAGVPSQNLAPDAFKVQVDNEDVSDVSIESFVDDAAQTDNMLVVDFGMTRRGQALPALREASEQILGALPPDDQIGFIAVTGKVNLGDTLNPPLNEAQETDFVQAGQGRNNIINLIRQLNPVPVTPLYDALCKAIILTAKRKVGTRAVVVLSDGNDAKASVACKEDDPIDRANRDRVPVFAIGIGNNINTGFLKRLAIQTNGVFLEADSAEAAVTKFAEVQRLLKTRYRVTFNSPAAADSAKHKIVVQLTVPAGRVEGTFDFSVAAPRPTLDQIRLGDASLDPGVGSITLLSNDVKLTPVFGGREVVRVEYSLETSKGTTTQRADVPPFAYTFSPADLESVTEAALTIKAISAPESDDSTTIVKLNVVPAVVSEPTAAATVAPAVVSTPRRPDTVVDRLTRPPLVYATGALAAVILIGLVGLVLVLVRRSKSGAAVQHTEVFAAPANEPATDYTSYQPTGVFAGDDHTSVFGVEPSGEGKTQVFGGGAGKTMIFVPPKAWLRVTSGAQKDKRQELGGVASKEVWIGREVPEEAPGNLKLTSNFVSRRHARVVLDNDTLYLTDEKSSSGTKVNDRPVRDGERVALAVGDVIQFGDVSALVEGP